MHTRLKTVFQYHKEHSMWFCRYHAGDEMHLLVICIILKYFLGKYISFSFLKSKCYGVSEKSVYMLFIKHETTDFVQAALSHTRRHHPKINGTLPMVTKHGRMEMMEKNDRGIKHNETTFPWKTCHVLLSLSIRMCELYCSVNTLLVENVNHRPHFSRRLLLHVKDRLFHLQR